MMKRTIRPGACARTLACGLILWLGASGARSQTGEPCSEAFDLDSFIARYATGERQFLANAFNFDPTQDADRSYLADIEGIRLSFYTIFPADSFPGATIRVMIHSASREAPDQITRHYCAEHYLTHKDVIDPGLVWFSVPYLFPQVWKILPVELDPPVPSGNDLISIGYDVATGDLERTVLFPGYDKFYAASGEAGSLFTDDSGNLQVGLTHRGLLERIPNLELGPPECEAPEPPEPPEPDLGDRFKTKLQNASCDGDTFIRIHVGPI